MGLMLAETLFMHPKSMFPALVAVAIVATAALTASAADKKDQAPAPTPTESEMIAKARANYPMKKCLVSDEDLGSMGDATPYVYKQAGKPDRVIFVCCEGCIDDFKVDPAKYMKKLDDAAAGKKGKAASAAKEEKKKHDD
jgi:hypothetical protein